MEGSNLNECLRELAKGMWETTHQSVAWRSDECAFRWFKCLRDSYECPAESFDAPSGIRIPHRQWLNRGRADRYPADGSSDAGVEITDLLLWAIPCVESTEKPLIQAMAAFLEPSPMDRLR